MSEFTDVPGDVMLIGITSLSEIMTKLFVSCNGPLRHREMSRSISTTR